MASASLIAVDAADLLDECDRLADRLRSLSDVRLARELSPGVTAAAAGLVVAQRLADLGAGVELREGASPPLVRTVPQVADFAVGDVVAVTGHDLVAAAAPLPLQTTVWLDAAPADLASVVADGAAACRALRLAL